MQAPHLTDPVPDMVDVDLHFVLEDRNVLLPQLRLYLDQRVCQGLELEGVVLAGGQVLQLGHQRRQLGDEHHNVLVLDDRTLPFLGLLLDVLQGLLEALFLDGAGLEDRGEPLLWSDLLAVVLDFDEIRAEIFVQTLELQN